MTAQLDLLPLPTLRSRLPGLADVQGDAWITDEGMYRWRLRRWWAEGPHVCWIMLNPSTADATRNDPTLREVMFHTRCWGHAGATVVNLYPLRSSQPADCRAWAERNKDGDKARYVIRDRMIENLGVVAAAAREAPLVVAAWGCQRWAEAWASRVVGDLRIKRLQLHCLGTTADGAPTHPLARGRYRVPRDVQPQLWRA